jgi:hypothetical protein
MLHSSLDATMVDTTGVGERFTRDDAPLILYAVPTVGTFLSQSSCFLFTHQLLSSTLRQGCPPTFGVLKSDSGPQTPLVRPQLPRCEPREASVATFSAGCLTSNAHTSPSFSPTSHRSHGHLALHMWRVLENTNSGAWPRSPARPVWLTVTLSGA